MKKIPYCVPDIFEAVLDTAKNVSDEIFIHKKLVITVIDKIASLEELGDSPHELMRICLRAAYKALGATDPFEEKKQRYGVEVSALSHYFEEYTKKFDNSLEGKLNIAATMNYKGLCACSLSGRSIEKRVKRLLESEKINQEELKELERVLKKAQSILFIVASAGEIIADKLLIDELSENYEVKVAVAPHPILCRATEEDAIRCGLDKVATIVDPGVDMYGVLLEKASSDFREIFKNSDIIIVKAGVNSRTLNNCGRDYFILGAGYSNEDDEEIDNSECCRESTIIRKYLKYVEA